jgi:KaiC
VFGIWTSDESDEGSGVEPMANPVSGGKVESASKSLGNAKTDFGKKLTTSLCLIGPDGTGKSAFGLHLAAQYMADILIPQRLKTSDGKTGEWTPRVLYVSTDLRHHVAKRMWDNFGLKKPNQRVFPFNWGYRHNQSNAEREVELTAFDPESIEDAGLDRRPDPHKASVHFVDLVTKTMGDDWSFVSRLLALLKTPPTGCTPHLMVVDAVEGFETLVGDRDAFGEITSRRARIAQIMRTAANKCHVCFIVEEPRAEARFPEEFVTDVVIRLRTVTVRNYVRRTVEILKVRGQSHVRGQHPFVIRGGTGSTTGSQENADDPKTPNGYINVYPSLHLLSRTEMETIRSSTPTQDSEHVAAFGIKYLDDMLARLAAPRREEFDQYGLRTQTTTALIGEASTRTSSLATAFLARTFRGFIFQLADVINVLGGYELPSSRNMRWIDHDIRRALELRLQLHEKRNLDGSHLYEDRIQRIIRAIGRKNPSEIEAELSGMEAPIPTAFSGPKVIKFAKWITAAIRGSGAAVLITTSARDSGHLTKEFSDWLEDTQFRAVQRIGKNTRGRSDKAFRDAFHDAVMDQMASRTVCRRLELHDLSSSILFQIIQQSVKKAQESSFLFDGKDLRVDRLPCQRSVRFDYSGNVRVVIDDLTTLKNTYPDIGADSIFLPSLLQFLELEGVTSLILDSQNGRPDAQLNDAFDRELRALVPHKLLTWRVPFFGSVRDAISLSPPYASGMDSMVREVRPQTPKDNSKLIFIDPELELYSGLEVGKPEPIPLLVQLFAESDPVSDYIMEENEIFERLFTALPIKDGTGTVVAGVKSSQYSALHDFCNLQTNTLMNHTLVFQVDEFWATDGKAAPRSTKSKQDLFSRREGALLPLGPYLCEETYGQGRTGEWMPDRIVDPYGLFNGMPIIAPKPEENRDKKSWQRRDYFTRSRGQLQDRSGDMSHVDRVPFAWDFGFLLCPESLWKLAEDRKVLHPKDADLTVGKVWEGIPKVVRKGPNEKGPDVPWRKFLGACRVVAQVHAERSSTSVSPLDVSTLAEESFLCLVLEIWASEIVELLPKDRKGNFIESLANNDWRKATEEGLHEWLSIMDYRLAFYRTWLLLVESLPMQSLTEDKTVPRIQVRRADGNAAATRHWYKTASKNQRCPVTGELALPVRLPGHFSVRGDWFLAIAGGSRSERLGRRALDLLSSRRANCRRMELGIGLPTRDISSIDDFRHLPTALRKHGNDGQITPVTYSDLVGTGQEQNAQFRWLWRSQLRYYHRQSQLIHSWLGQTVVLWKNLRNRIGHDWTDGFDVYDDIAGLSHKEAKKKLGKLDSWKMFDDRCAHLKRQMEVVGPRP